MCIRDRWHGGEPIKVVDLQIAAYFVRLFPQAFVHNIQWDGRIGIRPQENGHFAPDGGADAHAWNLKHAATVNFAVKLLPEARLHAVYHARMNALVEIPKSVNQGVGGNLKPELVAVLKRVARRVGNAMEQLLLYFCLLYTSRCV